MLIEIDCDLFRKGPIVFHQGLNVVLGGKTASNSIGKSTLLLIIDFVFGGESYFSSENDSIRVLGHHDVRFCHKFGKKKLYFIRNTKNNREVHCCNKGYVKTNRITASDFRNLLKENYKITQSDTTFRDIVGVFSRVWGKDNYYQHKQPLTNPNENAINAIFRLIKIWNRYNDIKNLQKEKIEVSEKIKAFKAASNKKIIPQITQAVYNEYIKEMGSISRDIDNITSDIAGIKTTYEAVVSDEVLALRDEKSVLIQKKNLYQEQLQKTRQNISTKSSGLSRQLEQIQSYFPNINIEKIKSIDLFHTNITSILNDELKAREQTLKEVLSACEKHLAELDIEISKKLNMKDTPQYLRDRLVDLVSKKSSYDHAISLYDEKEKYKKDLSAIDEKLRNILADILQDISVKINKKMEKLTKQIYLNSCTAPQITLEGNRYTFSSPEDTGTGRSYVNLITFDLAILSLGNLPLLIHDSLLFTNIETKTLENIIGIYKTYRKQIFIAIDEVQRLNDDTIKIIDSNKVCSLSSENTLFRRIWNKELSNDKE